MDFSNTIRPVNQPACNDRMIGERTLQQWIKLFQDYIHAQSQSADASHRFDHFYRVAQLAWTIAMAEQADLAVVMPASWLHDMVIIDKRSAQRSQASSLSAHVAVDYLMNVGYPAQYHAAIFHAIAAHSFSANIEATTLEAKVVQDADRCDALGATGVARTMMLGGHFNSALYHVLDPTGHGRDWDDKRYVLDHFYVKLLELAKTMKTPTGKAIAERRVAFMQQYIEQLLLELGAER